MMSLPVIAGFRRFFPVPPKSAFAATMPAAAAAAGIQSGTPGGMRRPVMMPVTAAVPSAMQWKRRVIRSVRSSAAIAPASALKIRRPPCRPKK